jgi:hypothetical protein
MTSPQPTGPTKDERIAHLFLTGYSLDLICEQGATRGWTRTDVRRVAEVNGWTLDSTGRIPSDVRTSQTSRPRPVAVAPPVTTAAPQQVARPVADLTLMPATALIERGNDHRVSTVRTKAKRAHDAVEALRQALLEQVAEDAKAAEQNRKTEEARAALAHLDAERARLLAIISPARSPRRAPSSTTTKPIEHGTARGARQHIARGQQVCAECQPALNEAMSAMRNRKAAGS